MLSVPAPFPHPGAQAFLVPNGEPCRILQQRGDGRVLVSLTQVSATHPDVRTRASGNRTVARDDLVESQDALAERLSTTKPRKRRAAKAKGASRP